MAECADDCSLWTPGSPPSTGSESGSDSCMPKRTVKQSRLNTEEEKRKMRRERKKRKRKMNRKRRRVTVQAKEVQEQHDSEHKRELVLYKQMARDYWDRWQWEMRQRKEEMAKKHATRSATKRDSTLHQIDPAQLCDPIPQPGQPTEVFLGRGSFSIVRLKKYRGIYVAVKQFRTQSQMYTMKHFYSLPYAIHTYHTFMEYAPRVHHFKLLRNFMELVLKL